MNTLPDDTTQPQIDQAMGAETFQQECARELIERIETDWDELWHEVKAATQSYCEANGASLPTELGLVVKEIRERYT